MSELAQETRGEGAPLTFLHGFTQTRTSWVPLLQQLRTPVRATLVDAPGHGGSRHPMDLPGTADAIATLAQGQTLVGYSMGARMCLTAVIRHPESFTRLVLISGTAGLDTEAERAARCASDEELAERIESTGVSAFVDEWLANPMFAGLTTENAQRAERLSNTTQGLAGSLRLAGTGTMTPLWDALARIKIPTLLVAGANDTKFCALAERMHGLIGSSELHIHPGVGHTVHLEDAAGCAAVIDDWLSRR